MDGQDAQDGSASSSSCRSCESMFGSGRLLVLSQVERAEPQRVTLVRPIVCQLAPRALWIEEDQLFAEFTESESPFDVGGELTRLVCTKAVWPTTVDVLLSLQPGWDAGDRQALSRWCAGRR